MSQNTTAGHLLESLHELSPSVRDAVADAAGLSSERTDAAMFGALRLSLSEQLRLAEATIALAPRLSRDGLRLRGQVLAARSYDAQELVDRQRDPPADPRDGLPRFDAESGSSSPAL